MKAILKNNLRLLAIAVGCVLSVRPSFAWGNDKAEDQVKNYYERAGWHAEDFFGDQQVLELCKAIEANDLQKMKELIDEGVDVNTKGKGNVTPLLWAFPGNKIERFKMLLNHGADPNVQLTEDMPEVGKVIKKKYIIKGDSVTWLAMKTSHDGYLEAVLKHGGDVNQVHPYWKKQLLHFAADFQKYDRVELLARHGADLKRGGAEL